MISPEPPRKTVTTTDSKPRIPASQTVAQKIVGLIRESGLGPGARLPTEKELSERYGVSRTVVREAIKVLSATGLVQTRRGSGLYVEDQAGMQFTTAINLSMLIDPEHVARLLEFRAVIETQGAQMAAERITPPELRALRETLEENANCALSGDIPGFLESDGTFHTRIAQATRNPFLVATVQGIFRFQHEAVDAITGLPGSQAQGAQEHRLIFEAIQGGEGTRAASAMQSHLENVTRNYRAAVRERLRKP